MNIARTSNIKDLEYCARLMADSEPWITLRRNYEQLIDGIQDSLKEVYVGKIDGEIAGAIVIQMVGTFKGYIQSICIGEKYRNQGIGTQLLRFAEERIFSETPNIFICVSSFNKGAYKLYRSLGFDEIGILKDFIVFGYSEILLRKTISPLSDFHKKV